MSGTSTTRANGWIPTGRFATSIRAFPALEDFNNRGVLPIEIDGLRSDLESVRIRGSSSNTLSLWNFSSDGQCIKTPRADVDLIAVHFVRSGSIALRCRGGAAVGTPAVAVISRFPDLHSLETEGHFDSIGCAFSPESLMTINDALTGGDNRGLPTFSLSADMATPGVRGLFCTMTEVHQRSRATDLNDDLTFPLIQEIVGYQFLSSWPKEVEPVVDDARHVRLNRLGLARDYIEANLSSPLMLSDIAASAGLSVRALQDNFRRSFDRTPFQYIIAHRLDRVREELLSPHGRFLPIADIARRWGFVHISDFGRRYRLQFGSTPSETRRDLASRS